jgi:hypothetical protein
LSDSLSTFFCFPLDPFFEENGLIVFQKSPDFVHPEQRSKKYVFIDFLFNLVTKFLCFLNDKIVNDQKEVANHFNKFFSTVAENIGKYTVYDPSDHPSLIEIKKQNDCKQ